MNKTIILSIAMIIVSTYRFAFSYDWYIINNGKDTLISYDKKSSTIISKGIVLAKTRIIFNSKVSDVQGLSGILQSTQLFDCVNSTKLIIESCLGEIDSDYIECKHMKNTKWEPINKVLREDLVKNEICSKTTNRFGVENTNPTKTSEFAKAKLADELCECYYVYTFLENSSNSSNDNDRSAVYKSLKEKSIYLANKYINGNYIKAKIEQQKIQFYVMLNTHNGYNDLVKYLAKNHSMCDYVVNNIDERYNFWESYQGYGK